MEIVTIILIIGVLAAAITYGAFTWGLVFFKFYYWFALPVFINLPNVNYWESIGLVCFLSLFKNTSHREIKEEYREKNKELVNALLHPWLILFLGWIIHLLIK